MERRRSIGKCQAKAGRVRRARASVRGAERHRVLARASRLVEDRAAQGAPGRRRDRGRVAARVAEGGRRVDSKFRPGGARARAEGRDDARGGGGGDDREARRRRHQRRRLARDVGADTREAAAQDRGRARAVRGPAVGAARRRCHDDDNSWRRVVRDARGSPPRAHGEHAGLPAENHGHGRRARVGVGVARVGVRRLGRRGRRRGRCRRRLDDGAVPRRRVRGGGERTRGGREGSPPVAAAAARGRGCRARRRTTKRTTEDIHGQRAPERRRAGHGGAETPRGDRVRSVRQTRDRRGRRDAKPDGSFRVAPRGDAASARGAHSRGEGRPRARGRHARRVESHGVDSRRRGAEDAAGAWGYDRRVVVVVVVVERRRVRRSRAVARRDTRAGASVASARVSAALGRHGCLGAEE